jgi:CheY-like chemotaxis protein
MADPQHLEQIVLHLVRNADEAMGSIGKLTISTTPIRLSEAHARRELLALPGQFVCLAIHDTGCGMNAEVQSHVFEPFFTTKDTGKGTGLGLASVNGIVRQHGGWIEFSTKEGLGAEFRVFFPCAAVQPAAKQMLGESAPVPAKPKTVLLVEAEDRARTLARFVLERQGFRVIEADDGPTALLLWEGNGAKVDLVLANISLRDGQSGEALVKQLQETRPELKVIYSGDSEPDGEAKPLSLPEGSKFVAKPYSHSRLLEAVNGCLAA